MQDLGHCHSAIVQSGPTITSLQDLQTLTVLSLLKRSAPGRSFCEAGTAHDTFHTCENNKDDKHDAFHTCKDDKDDKHSAFHTYGNVKNSKTAAAIEIESATHSSLNQAQSTAMCNILMSGTWDSKTQALLEPFVKGLSTSLVARVLNCLTNVDTVKRFFHWAGQQDSYKHNTYVYNALLMKLGLAKDFIAMWELLDEMRREGCAATNSTFSIIIQYYGKAGLLEECWRTINKATSFGVKPDAHMYTALLGVLFDAGKVDKAKQLLGRMIHYNTVLDMRSWSTVIHGLCKNRKLQDAQMQDVNQIRSRITLYLVGS